MSTAYLWCLQAGFARSMFRIIEPWVLLDSGYCIRVSQPISVSIFLAPNFAIQQLQQNSVWVQTWSDVESYWKFKSEALQSAENACCQYEYQSYPFERISVVNDLEIWRYLFCIFIMLFLIMLIVIYKCSVFNVSPNPQFKVTGKSYGDVIGAEEGSTPPDSPIFITLSFSYFL